MRKTIRRELVIYAGLLFTSNAFSAQALPLTVATDEGQVIGVNQDGYHAFKGIPYAKPPVGALRWMPPVPAGAWTSPLIANKFGNICATKYSLGGFGTTSESEDCLYLNVYTPSKLSEGAEKMPVMLWIHGGGLRTGSGDDYDVSRLVNKGVVVVTFNYRLGMFGFFSHPALNAEGHPAINYGTMDQQAAMVWVRKNIRQFGGNKDNVTIFGESAGGHSVLAQVVSPEAKGLFQKAIVSSGSYSLTQPSIDEANRLGQQIADRTGCGNLEGEKAASCLRTVSTVDILNEGANYLLIDQVVTDGKVVPISFIDAFRTGRFNHVPIINGFNSNEGTFFAGLTVLTSGHPIGRFDYLNGLKAFLGDKKGEALFAVANPPAEKADLGVDYAGFFGRAKFICPTPMVNSMVSKYVPVFAYEFDDVTAPPLLVLVSFPYKAAHTSELQYIFKDFHGATGKSKPLDEKQQALSSAMVSYWTNFARTGNPNGEGRPRWQAFSSRSEATIEFAPDNIATITRVSEKYRCGELSAILKW